MVDLIDARGIHRGDGPGNRTLANLYRQLLAALGGEQFGIAQAANAVAWIEDHSGGHDRAEERSATNLIDSGHEFGAHGPSPPFKLERAAQFFQEPQLGRGGRDLIGAGRLRGELGLVHGGCSISIFAEEELQIKRKR